jgi:hypothetical protein
MFYKPKYCCNCGEEIEKTDRSLLSSGRFCDVCSDDFKPQEWLPRITVLGGVVLALFGLGSFLQPGENSLNVAAKQFSETPPSRVKETKNTKTQVPDNPVVQSPVDLNGRANTEKQLQTSNKSNLQTRNEIVESKVSDLEPTYFCGAATKKGSPCSRRVKGNARCWQHMGQPAILASEKLLISR